MFLRNWDNLMLAANFPSLENDDSLRTFGDNSISYVNINGRVIEDRGNYIYGLAIASNKQIYIGGTASVNYYSHPELLENEVDYEDYELFHRFVVETSDKGINSGTIYAQNPVYSKATFNKDKGIWERTITREFKNNTEENITIKEIGLYLEADLGATSGSNIYLLAKEVLSTPVIVEPEAYFKASFTYTCPNPYPHKNRYYNRLYEFKGFYPTSNKSFTISNTSNYYLVILDTPITNLDALITAGIIVSSQKLVEKQYCYVYIIKTKDDIKKISFETNSSGDRGAVLYSLNEKITEISITEPITEQSSEITDFEIEHNKDVNEFYLLAGVMTYGSYLYYSKIYENSSHNCDIIKFGSALVNNNYKESYYAFAPFVLFADNIIDTETNPTRHFSKIFSSSNYKVGTYICKMTVTTENNEPLFTITEPSEVSDNSV